MSHPAYQNSHCHAVILRYFAKNCRAQWLVFKNFFKIKLFSQPFIYNINLPSDLNMRQTRSF